MTDTAELLQRHVKRLARCRRCPKMQGTPVIGRPVVSPVMLIGQAPGLREAALRQPFAWTAGKTLFGWFRSIGIEEEAFRSCVYMAAVCRCFPGKNPNGGDRVPDPTEILNCATWMNAEFALLQPQLVIPAGKLAIARVLEVDRLETVVGKQHRVKLADFETDVIPLPHPSGASIWHRIEPGRTLLRRALELIAAHPAWRALQRSATGVPRR